MPPSRHRLATTLSIAGLLALGPLVWLLASVIAPNVLPAPESGPMRLEPVASITLRPAVLAVHATTTASEARTTPPEPIAERWRTGPDGRLVFPMDAPPPHLADHDPRRNVP